MIVHIKMVRPSAELIDDLESDGWQVEEKDGESLTACHDRVSSESEARQRLQDMGLLTSTQLRIRFVKKRRQFARS